MMMMMMMMIIIIIIIIIIITIIIINLTQVFNRLFLGIRDHVHIPGQTPELFRIR